jgi:hypothetical protein
MAAKIKSPQVHTAPSWWNDSKLVRIRFAPRETGWAIDMGDGTYRLANTPIVSFGVEPHSAEFQRLPTWGDLVRIRGGRDEETYLEIIEKHQAPLAGEKL